MVKYLHFPIFVLFKGILFCDFAQKCTRMRILQSYRMNQGWLLNFHKVYFSIKMSFIALSKCAVPQPISVAVKGQSD